MRYVITLIFCAVISVGSVIVWLAETLPKGEGSFGVAKMVPIILVVFSTFAFFFIWFPANLSVYIWHRYYRKSSTQLSNGKPVVIVSMIPFCFCLYYVTTTWIPAWHRDQIEKHYETLAMGTTINSKDFKPAIDAYCTESQGGLWPDRGDKKLIETLIHNRATPSDLLGQLADGLDDRSYFLRDIAAHPNCPTRLDNRLESIPLVVSHLAQNPHASPTLLDSLSLSTNAEVRICVARNLNTPRETLERLTKDSENTVQNFAKMNLGGSLGDFAWR